MSLRNYFVVLDYNEQKLGGFSQYEPDIARIPRSETRKELDKIFEVEKEYWNRDGISYVLIFSNQFL